MPLGFTAVYPRAEPPAVDETSQLGEVWGMKGFMLDGACLPMLPEKSLTLTIMANADRIGSSIAMNLYGDRY